MIRTPNLIARDKEISILAEAEKSPRSEFIAVYGRRRIGKTFLIREYFKSSPFYFELVGSENSTTKLQIKNFVRELTKTFKPKDQPKIADWSDAFHWLRDIIEASPVKASAKKVVFFDELPWLASRKSAFTE